MIILQLAKHFSRHIIFILLLQQSESFVKGNDIAESNRGHYAVDPTPCQKDPKRKLHVTLRDNLYNVCDGFEYLFHL